VNDRRNVPSVDGAITPAQDRAGRSGAQHVGVVDVVAAGDQRVHQGHQLAARTGTTYPVDHAHGVVDQSFKTKTHDQRGDEHQTRAGDEVLVVEGHLNAVERVQR